MGTDGMANLNNGESTPTGKRKSKKVIPEGNISWDDHAEDKVDGNRIKFLEDLKLNKLKSDKYSKDMVKRLSGHEVTVAHIQREGFNNPIFVPDKDGLGIKVPSKNFTVGDVRSAVGSRRLVDVIDVYTQKNSQMTMKDWHKYFDLKRDERTDLLNVISLEVSNTKLDSQIQAPKLVRQIDWVDKVWPRHLKEMQIEATNNMDDMMYPKVQKYCLMSVEGCWTDFHIDLGGTSVWYHVIKGGKVFWLIPPTDENLRRYEEWILSDRLGDVFFGDMVENCQRFEIPQGGTFFIPSGWIHGVYTPTDSIVFGGNFLHSYGIEKQLQIAHIEEVTHVHSSARFPFFTEMLWYALDRYIHCLMGKTHLDLPEEEKRRMRLEKGDNVDTNKEILKLVNPSSDKHPNKNAYVHLTMSELLGIKFIVMYLHHLPHSKKNVPIMLPDPVSVIKDIRTLVMDHRNDCPDQAITGKYILRWTENDNVDNPNKKPRKHGKSLPTSTPSTPNTTNQNNSISSANNTPNEKERKKSPAKSSNANNTENNKNKNNDKRMSYKNHRRRRVRCKTCEACIGGDCKNCVYCKDMTKYGGPGKMKQTCEKRRCLHPQLPVCAYCSVCNLDGWMNEPKVQGKETDRPDEPPNLFECTVCLDIMHPQCAEKSIGRGQINPDLSNSWECAKCINSGFSSAPSRSTSGSKRPNEDSSGGSPAGKKSKVDDNGP